MSKYLCAGGRADGVLWRLETVTRCGAAYNRGGHRGKSSVPSGHREGGHAAAPTHAQTHLIVTTIMTFFPVSIYTFLYLGLV